MKDLNELLQTILDVDAAQRKATEDAMKEREELQGQLKQQKQAIADELAAAAQQKGKAAAAEAEAANRQALQQLQQAADAAAEKLEADVKAHKDEWAQELYSMALGLGSAAQPKEVKKNAAAE